MKYLKKFNENIEADIEDLAGYKKPEEYQQEEDRQTLFDKLMDMTKRNHGPTELSKWVEKLPIDMVRTILETL